MTQDEKPISVLRSKSRAERQPLILVQHLLAGMTLCIVSGFLTGV